MLSALGASWYARGSYDQAAQRLCEASDLDLSLIHIFYVVNDFGRKNLYRNNGDGTFTDIAPQAGAEDIGARCV